MKIYYASLLIKKSLQTQVETPHLYLYKIHFHAITFILTYRFVITPSPWSFRKSC